MAFILLVLIITFSILEGGLRIIRPLWKYVYQQFSDDVICVYVIGGSTALGQPYHSKISFPKIILYLFNEEINGKKIKIINLAEAGQPLEYGYWKLFQELFLRPPREGILLIYSGINDFIRDTKGYPLTVWKILQESILLSKIHWWWRCFAPEENLLSKYEYQLEKTIRLAFYYDIKPIVSTLICNFAEFLPFEDFNNSDSQIDIPLFVNLFKIGKEYEVQNGIEEAFTIYEEMPAMINAPPAMFYYRLGKYFEHCKDYERARECYLLSMRFQSFSLSFQNDTIRKVAKRNDVGLVDSAEIFEQASPNKLVGYNLFIDQEHPNLKGYQLIADGFAKEIEKIMNVRKLFMHTSEEDIFNHFDFDERDLFYVYISNVYAFTYYMCQAINLPDGKIKRAEYYLKQAEALFPHDPQILLGRLMVAVAKKEKSDVMDLLHDGKFMNDNRDLLRQHIDWLEPYLKELIPSSTLRMIKENSRKND